MLALVVSSPPLPHIIAPPPAALVPQVLQCTTAALKAFAGDASFKPPAVMEKVLLQVTARYPHPAAANAAYDIMVAQQTAMLLQLVQSAQSLSGN